MIPNKTQKSVEMLNAGLVLLGIMLTVSSIVSCTRQGNKKLGNESESLQYPYTIITTTGFVYDIVHAIVGSRANVTQIIKSGIDPHTYVPTRTDVVDIYFGDIIFYSGLHLEGGMYNVFNRIQDRARLYAVGEIVESPLMLDNVGKSIEDPHIWMDVRIWISGTKRVAQVLSEFDPNNAVMYQNNAKRYIRVLERLDLEMRAMFDTIPQQKRVLVTSHDAFNYFGRSYGFKVYGIQGISTISEASLKHISDLIHIIIDLGVKAVFIESTISPKYVRALIEGAKSRGYFLEEGGQLFADSLGSAGTKESNYVGMMLYNAKLITSALGGVVSRVDIEDIQSLDPAIN